MSFEPEQTSHRALSTYKSLTSPTTDPKRPISDDEFVPACQLVTQVVSRANQYGASFVRLQNFMSQLPHLFGFHGVMLAAAPFIFFEFWRQGDAQPSRVTVRPAEGSFDLSKLTELGILVNDLVDGKVPIDDGMSRLEQIDSLPLPYKSQIVALGYALCGAGIAVLLSANWLDVFFAALLSLVVYAVTLTAERTQWLANRLNFTAALIVSILANLLALLFPGSNAFIVSLCAVVVLVPGLSLTLGVAELASKIVILGVSRLVDGALVTFSLVAGSAVGSALVAALWISSAPVIASSRPLWMTFLAVIPLMLGLAFVFQVRLADLGWVILAGSFAYMGVIIGGQLGNWQGSFLGALILGIYTSLFTFRLRRPGSIVMLPGVMILVPGVAAYFGLNTLQTSGIIGALPTAWGVIVQITAIIGGLYVAVSVLPPKATL